jgi:hypothetical protein
MRFCYANISSLSSSICRTLTTPRGGTAFSELYSAALSVVVCRCLFFTSSRLDDFASGLGMFCLRVIPNKMEYHKDRSSAWPCLQSPSTFWWMQLGRLLLRRCTWTPLPSTTILGALSQLNSAVRALSTICLGEFGRTVLCSPVTVPNVYIWHAWGVTSWLLSVSEESRSSVCTEKYVCRSHPWQQTLLGARRELLTCEMRTGTEYFKSFVCTISERRPDGAAPTLLCAYQLQDSLRQLHVGSAKKLKLPATVPVQNNELGIATGAFRTRRLESLHAECDEPLLIVGRNLFSANTSRGWQRNQRIHHTGLCSIPPSATGTISYHRLLGLWVYSFMISYSDLT